MDFKDNDKLRSFYPTLKLQGLNRRNDWMPFPVHFPPLSSHMCNKTRVKPSLQVSFLHIPLNFKSNLAYMLLYLVQSASTLLIFSQTHKRVHLKECKHFKQLYTVPPNIFLFTNIHQISAILLEVKKETW